MADTLTHRVTVKDHRAECDCGAWVSDKHGSRALLEAWAVDHMQRRNGHDDGSRSVR